MRRRRAATLRRRRRSVQRRRRGSSFLRRRRSATPASTSRRRRRAAGLIEMAKHKGVGHGFDRSASAHVASLAAAGVERPFAGYVNLEYVPVGCYPRASDDKDPISELRDKTCASPTFKTDEPCRSNLPFFRTKVEADGAVDQCFTFCTQKGLDVFGLLDARTECRCGATPENVALWGKWTTVAARRKLLWQYPKHAKVSGDGKCHEVEVYKYTGWLEEPEADGVSRLLLRASLRDVLYIDKVVRGDGVPEPSLGNVALPANKQLAVIGKLWPTTKHGVKVKFAFMPELGNSGRHAFLAAAKVWSYYSMECLSFREVKADQSVLQVSSSGSECGPDEPGYPGKGKGKKRMLSLNGCGNYLHLHFVVQALGSVLGLAIDGEGQEGLNPDSIKMVLEKYKCDQGAIRKSSFAQSSRGSALLQELATDLANRSLSS